VLPVPLVKLAGASHGYAATMMLVLKYQYELEKRRAAHTISGSF
jgi:hypothetical protein